MRKTEAEIILDYDDLALARAVQEAISPDNTKTPHGLIVKTVRKQRKVISRIDCDEKLFTFCATIDDLIASASVAEKTVQVAMQASKTR